MVVMIRRFFEWGSFFWGVLSVVLWHFWMIYSRLDCFIWQLQILYIRTDQYPNYLDLDLDSAQYFISVCLHDNAPVCSARTLRSTTRTYSHTPSCCRPICQLTDIRYCGVCSVGRNTFWTACRDDLLQIDSFWTFDWWNTCKMNVF